MNYLAHAYLSFNHPQILCGNMMGDFVKGKHYENYDYAIQQGIHLHRYIDHFTDQHEDMLDAVQLFKKQFPLSAGVFVDIFFDHFLARHPDYFTEEGLKKFTLFVYQTLSKHEGIFNEQMKNFFGYMEQYDWLYHYQFIPGIEKSIYGMCKRYPRLGNPKLVMDLFELHYQSLQEKFNLFFPHLVNASKQKYQTLI